MSAGVLVGMRPGGYFNPARRYLGHYILICVVVVDGLGRYSYLLFLSLVLFPSLVLFLSLDAVRLVVELCGLVPHLFEDDGHSTESILHCHHALLSLLACLFLLSPLKNPFIFLQAELFVLVLFSHVL